MMFWYLKKGRPRTLPMVRFWTIEASIPKMLLCVSMRREIQNAASKQTQLNPAAAEPSPLAIMKFIDLIHSRGSCPPTLLTKNSLNQFRRIPSIFGPTNRLRNWTHFLSAEFEFSKASTNPTWKPLPFFDPKIKPPKYIQFHVFWIEDWSLNQNKTEVF